MSDGSWGSSDDEGFGGGGGMTLEDLARQNAEATWVLLEKMDSRLFGDGPEPELEPEPEPEPVESGPENDFGGGLDGYAFGGGGFDPYSGCFGGGGYGGGGFDPYALPKETPVHEEWSMFPNLRVRGVAIVPPDGWVSTTKSAVGIGEAAMGVEAGPEPPDLDPWDPSAGAAHVPDLEKLTVIGTAAVVAHHSSLETMASGSKLEASLEVSLRPHEDEEEIFAIDGELEEVLWICNGGAATGGGSDGEDALPDDDESPPTPGEVRAAMWAIANPRTAPPPISPREQRAHELAARRVAEVSAAVRNDIDEARAKVGKRYTEKGR